MKMNGVGLSLSPASKVEKLAEEGERCSDCDESFYQLAVHRAVVHRSKSHILCRLCGLSFHRQKYLEEHSTRHSSEKIRCSVCKCKFEDTKSLLRHVEQHKSLHIFKCEHCSKTYALGKHYSKHVRGKHSSEVDLSTLNENNLKSNNANSLITSLNGIDVNKTLNHRNDVLFNGGKETTNELVDLLKLELLSDSMSISDSFCAMCNHSFESIQQHLSIVHCASTPYVCNFCGFITHKEKVSRNHLKTHSLKESSVCYVCQKKFDDVRSLLKHIEVHEELHLYKCKDCSRTFALGEHYERHVRKKHGAISLTVNRSLNLLSGDCLETNRTEFKMSSDSENRRGKKRLISDDVDERVIGDEVDVVDERHRTKSNGKPAEKLNTLSQDRDIKRIKLKSQDPTMELCDEENAGLSKSNFRNWDGTSKISWMKMFKDVDSDLGNRDVDPRVDWTCFQCKDVIGRGVFYHFFDIHNRKSPLCPICKKVLVLPNGKGYHRLYWHVMKHYDLYPWRCQTCGKKYKSKFSLFKHIKIVHDKLKLHVCGFCGERYSYRTTFAAHLSSHKNPEDLVKFECYHCTNKYTYKKNLLTHLQPSECLVCEINFVCRSFYNSHFEAYHKDDKSFLCPHCDRSYKTERTRNTHITTKHFELSATDKILNCKLCGYFTNHTKNLARHRRTYHRTKK